MIAEYRRAAAATLWSREGETAGDGIGMGLATLAEPYDTLACEEEANLAHAMARERRAEFLIGRLAAHRALGHAGLSQAPVLAKEGRPLFAVGVVGTISHSGGIAIAMVGPADRHRSVGIDLEFGRMPLRAARLVLDDAEQRSLALGGPILAARLLLKRFSAKEAAFKALDPILDGGAPRLRQLRLVPGSDGYVCWSVHAPGVKVLVRSQTVCDGVLSWTYGAP